MRKVKYAEEHYVDLKGNAHCLEYSLLEETGRPCRYGVAVEDRGGDRDRAAVRDVTTRRERAEEVLELLRRNLVTPVALLDVVQDLL